LEAHKNRDGLDLRQSHDFEDIIYILDNCPALIENISKSNANVNSRGWLTEGLPEVPYNGSNSFSRPAESIY
jgi:hypothetical protein